MLATCLKPYRMADFPSTTNIQAFHKRGVLMSRPACDPLCVCVIRVILNWQYVNGNDNDTIFIIFFCCAPLLLWFVLASCSMTHVIQELLVGEVVRSLTCLAFSLQEQSHAVPRRVSDAAAPQGLCDPQQLTHTSRDDLQERTAGTSPLIKYMFTVSNLYPIRWSHWDWEYLVAFQCDHTKIWAGWEKRLNGYMPKNQ